MLHLRSAGSRAEETPFLAARRRNQKPAPPVTPLSNLLFMASLVLTFGFVSSRRENVARVERLAFRGILFVGENLLGPPAIKQQLALRPVTVPRLDN